MTPPKKEDNLSKLEVRIHELERYIADKSCFGLKMDGVDGCVKCELGDICPEYVDERLVMEERSMWAEEAEEAVDSELEELGEKKTAEKKEDDSTDSIWVKAVKRITKDKPSTLDGVVRIMVEFGMSDVVAGKASAAVIKNLVASGIVEFDGSTFTWKK